MLVGTKHFLFTIENAYQKIKKYETGYFEIGTLVEYCFKVPDGQRARYCFLKKRIDNFKLPNCKGSVLCD